MKTSRTLALATAVMTLLATPFAAADGPPASAMPLIPPGAAVQTVAEGFTFVEGPALAPDGSIYFSDIPRNAIHRYDPATGKTTPLTEDSGGANGLMCDALGLVACAGGSRSITRYDRAVTTTGFTDPPDTLADRCDQRRFNSPNDLAISDQGVIYFTDPRYGNRDNMEQPTEAVYALIPEPVPEPVPALASGDAPALGSENLNDHAGYRVVRLMDDLQRPNGIGLSPDNRTLYVNDNAAQKVMAYHLAAPDTAANGRVLHDLADLGGPDGMCVDAKGRLYVAVFGRGIAVLSPQGQRLGFIETGPQTTNCAFGRDEAFLYITAEKRLKRVALNTDAPLPEPQ